MHQLAPFPWMLFHRKIKRIERVLSSTVAQCTGDDVPECPVIDALTEVT